MNINKFLREGRRRSHPTSRQFPAEKIGKILDREKLPMNSAFLPITEIL
jgi:hypothetical protein